MSPDPASGQNDVITYRSVLSSVQSAVMAYCFGAMTALLVMASTGLRDHVLFIVSVVPIPIACWVGLRVSVALRPDGSVDIRNELRSYRLESITHAIPRPTGPKGQMCINFLAGDGRMESASAMLLWQRGFFRFRPSRSTKRLDKVLQNWAETCRTAGVAVSLDASEIDRKEARNRHFHRKWDNFEFIDPVESIRSVRRTTIGDVLIFIRPTHAGFRVIEQMRDGTVVDESPDLPSLDAATDHAVAEVRRRLEEDGRVRRT